MKTTNHCKICGENIDYFDFLYLLSAHICVCKKCREKMNAVFKESLIENYRITFVYNYDETIKQLINQLKNYHDIELASIFLDRYVNILKIKYKNYVIVPAPSNKKDDEKRGFNHVYEIFKCLNLPTLNCVYKKEEFKQAEQTPDNRFHAKNYLAIDNANLYGKNILIVDDVFTSGSTVRSMVNLIKTKHPKRIEILIIAKTTRE